MARAEGRNIRTHPLFISNEDERVDHGRRVVLLDRLHFIGWMLVLPAGRGSALGHLVEVIGLGCCNVR